MKKTLWVLTFIIIWSGSLFGQTEENIDNYCLFGYISSETEEYSQVIGYLDDLGIQVVSNCDDEKLIYVILNKKYKDYTVLFDAIEKRFSGACYYKSRENDIPRYNKCREQYIKQNL